MHLRTRIIPVLLLKNGSLVKTIKFKKFTYVGDPCNTVKIFNELEVDELIFLDIDASKHNREPDFNLLRDISNECFMPLVYGGGIKTVDQAKRIFDIGFEKIAINTGAILNPRIISDVASIYGSQAIIASIDVKRFFMKYRVVYLSGKKTTNLQSIEWAKELESLGAGEILLTSIDKEGTWEGPNIDLIQQISENITIPVIAQGGFGSINDIEKALAMTSVSAVALGNLVTFQKKGCGVLINFPKDSLIKAEII